MPVNKTITLYKYDELDDEAKEKARASWRLSALDYDWWDCIYEDFETICGIVGVELKRRTKSTHKPTSLSEPCIWWSGFSSQGDGACFEGRYRHAKDASRLIREHAPVDEELHKIVDALQAVQEDHGGNVVCDIRHRGNYYHEYTMQFEFLDWEEMLCGEWVQHEATPAVQGQVEECLRDLARWLYKTLEADHDHLLSDEAIEENLQDSECLFIKTGRPYNGQ